MTLPVYNIVLGNADGVEIMSLVESPAVDSDFLAFEKVKQPLQFALNEEQRIVFGVAIRADYPIYRIGSSGFEYYVVFTKEIIKQLRDKFFSEKRTDLVNLEHSVDVKDVYLIDSFIKDSSKGLSPVGFEDIEEGSWFVAYKIDNDVIWNKIKAGEFKGFSIEGTFEFEKRDETEAIIDEILEN